MESHGSRYNLRVILFLEPYNEHAWGAHTCRGETVAFAHNPYIKVVSRLEGRFAKAQLGNIVPSVFTPVLAKHSKSFSLIDCVSVGVDRMQRNFEPMRKQVEEWQRSELTDVAAKVVVIYKAFVGPIGGTEAPGSYGSRSLLRAITHCNT